MKLLDSITGDSWFYLLVIVAVGFPAIAITVALVQSRDDRRDAEEIGEDS